MIGRLVALRIHPFSTMPHKTRFEVRLRLLKPKQPHQNLSDLNKRIRTLEEQNRNLAECLVAERKYATDLEKRMNWWKEKAHSYGNYALFFGVTCNAFGILGCYLIK